MRTVEELVKTAQSWKTKCLQLEQENQEQSKRDDICELTPLSGAADWRGPPLTLALKQGLQFALTNAWWRSIHSFLGIVFTSRVGYR